MDERQQSQAALIIAHQLDLAQRAAEQQAQATYAMNSAKGILGSGATVKAVSAAIGDGSAQLLTTLVSLVSNVSKAPEAFGLVETAMESHFANVDSVVVDAARMASCRGPGEPHPSILGAAQNLFEQIKSDTRAQLAIERFAFVETQNASDPSLAGATGPLATSPPNKGGKPLAGHWDEMWSSIAVQLWQGDLEPNTQADISKAMLDWFSVADIDIGETAVRKRARQLWTKYEAAKLGH